MAAESNTNAQGFNARLNSVGKNLSGSIIQLDYSVLKFKLDGTTKVLSN